MLEPIKFILLEALNNIKAEAFRQRLLEKYGVGVIATGESDIRIAFSCVEVDDIPALFELMFECAQEMQDSDKNFAAKAVS